VDQTKPDVGARDEVFAFEGDLVFNLLILEAHKLQQLFARSSAPVLSYHEVWLYKIISVCDLSFDQVLLFLEVDGL